VARFSKANFGLKIAWERMGGEMQSAADCKGEKNNFGLKIATKEARPKYINEYVYLKYISTWVH
jgi:hypothetical protein